MGHLFFFSWFSKRSRAKSKDPNPKENVPFLIHHENHKAVFECIHKYKKSYTSKVVAGHLFELLLRHNLFSSEFKVTVLPDYIVSIYKKPIAGPRYDVDENYNKDATRRKHKRDHQSVESISKKKPKYNEHPVESNRCITKYRKLNVLNRGPIRIASVEAGQEIEQIYQIGTLVEKQETFKGAKIQGKVISAHIYQEGKVTYRVAFGRSGVEVWQHPRIRLLQCPIKTTQNGQPIFKRSNLPKHPSFFPLKREVNLKARSSRSLPLSSRTGYISGIQWLHGSLMLPTYTVSFINPSKEDWYFPTEEKLMKMFDIDRSKKTWIAPSVEQA